MYTYVSSIHLIMAKYVVLVCIVVFLKVWLTSGLEDELYTCTGWHKRCLDEDSENGDLKVYSGEYFNCYIGYTPTCTEFLPNAERGHFKFCEDLKSGSKYSSTLELCQVDAEKVDEDANHFAEFLTSYS